MSEKYTAQLSVILAEQMPNRMFLWKRRVLVHVVETIRMSCDLTHGPQSEWQGLCSSQSGWNVHLLNITIYKIIIE